MKLIGFITVFAVCVTGAQADWAITNAGWESSGGWVMRGDGKGSLDHSTWGPGSSYKQDDGSTGGSHWWGADGCPADWGVAQAITGVDLTSHTYDVGINSGDRGASNQTQQLRVADGDVTATCGSGTGTQVALHTGVIPAWGTLNGGHTAGSTTVTVILWATNASGDGWTNNGGNDFDGLTIDGVTSYTTAVTDWSLY